MPTKMSVKHKSTNWQWKWQLQSHYSRFHNTNTTYSKNLMKKCLLFTRMPPYCCDIRCDYVGKLVLDRSCPSFQLGILTVLLHFSVSEFVFSKFQVQWIAAWVLTDIMIWCILIHLCVANDFTTQQTKTKTNHIITGLEVLLNILTHALIYYEMVLSNIFWLRYLAPEWGGVLW